MLETEPLVETNVSITTLFGVPGNSCYLLKNAIIAAAEPVSASAWTSFSKSSGEQ
jgi:hypothetical protein